MSYYQQLTFHMANRLGTYVPSLGPLHLLFVEYLRPV